MFKAPLILPMVAAVLVSAGAASADQAPRQSRPAAHARKAPDNRDSGFRSLDGHLDTDQSGDAEGWDLATPVGTGADRDAAGPQGPSNLDLGAATRSSDTAGGRSAAIGLDALPPAEFTGEPAAKTADGPTGVWLLLSRVRYGGLPEPASWALILIGFGMIGAVSRGFILANRRLARLRSEDGEEA